MSNPEIVGRLCQTLISKGGVSQKRPTILDFIIKKSLAIGPLLPMLDQPCAHRIFSNVVPFLVNRLRGTKETIKPARLPSARLGKIIKLVEPSLQPFQKRSDA